MASDAALTAVRTSATGLGAGTLVLILLSVSISAAAQICFKMGTTARPAGASHGAASLLMTVLTPGVMGGLVLYGLGTLVWLAVLSKVDVSQAYPFVGLGFVLTAVFGACLGEPVSLLRIVGIVVITVGISLVARS